MNDDVLVFEVGARFGRLTLVERLPNHPRYGRTWRCVCFCGGMTERSEAQLRRNAKLGRVSSCGCNKPFACRYRPNERVRDALRWAAER